LDGCDGRVGGKVDGFDDGVGIGVEANPRRFVEDGEFAGLP
jgi:hypothetical protein